MSILPIGISFPKDAEALFNTTKMRSGSYSPAGSDCFVFANANSVNPTTMYNTIKPVLILGTLRIPIFFSPFFSTSLSQRGKSVRSLSPN